MANKNKKYIWPDGESACIWMEAGIIDFKLCDNAGDCENCAFDAIMKNERSIARHQPHKRKMAATSTTPLQRLKTLDWDQTSYYGNRYWFVEPLGKTKALLGLNELAMHIAPTVKDTILTEEGDVEKDQAIGWLVTDYGTICLNAPFDATIRKANPALSADMSSRDKKAWLFTIDKKNLASELTTLKKGKSAESFLNRGREQLLDIFETEMIQMSADVGLTMPDGGVIVSSLEEMIGPKRYFKIICEFFQRCAAEPESGI